MCFNIRCYNRDRRVLCTCIRSHDVAVQTLPAVHSVVVHLVVHFIPVTSILHHLLHETAAAVIKLETPNTFLKSEWSSTPSFVRLLNMRHTITWCHAGLAPLYLHSDKLTYLYRSRGVLPVWSRFNLAVWSISHLYRWSPWMREIVIGVKVERVNRQQTFILPHLSRDKISVKVVTLPDHKSHDCEARCYRFVALDIGFAVFLL